MVVYGEKCTKDSDCPSKICELSFDGGTPERKCVVQNTKYGEPCNYNQDCDSNRCVPTYDDKGNFEERKCVIIEGQVIPERRDFEDAPSENDPDFMKSDAYQSAKNQEFILTNKQKRIAFQGRGPITDMIVLSVELVIVVYREFFKILFNFFNIFAMIFSAIFGFIPANWWSFSRRYRENGKCNNRSYTISKNTIVLIYTFLFPPLGVFIDRGVYGFGHILMTGFLTSLFYFPGLTYALTLVNDTLCPNSIEIFEDINFKGRRLKLSYGDYNRKDYSFDDYPLCYNHDHKIPIGSMKVGKNVNVRLYTGPNFTNHYYTVTESTNHLVNKIPGEHVDNNCLTNIMNGKKNKANITALSIRLKKPKKIKPEKVDDDTVVLYLLNDFRGQNIVLKTGDYDEDELTPLFNNRVSSMRIGKNVKIKLHEDRNYNRIVWLKYDLANRLGGNTTQTMKSNGASYVFRGDMIYDTEKEGEVAVLSNPEYDSGFNDRVSSLQIKLLEEDFDMFD